MKDMSLSLLSRGWGRLVSSGRDTGRRDGRLDVCFTPQDYYIWKSQESLLRLSHSGRLLVEAEATLPKTYSTRRGPLLLYSQDLVTLESRSHPKTRDEKQRVVRRHTRQVEQQLSTVKDLTAAILKYSNNQFSSSRPAPPLLPPLHLHPAPDPQRPGPELSVHLNSPFLPAERNSEEPENHLEDEEGEHSSSRRRVRLDLFLHVPTPPTQPQPREYRAALTPEERRRPVVTRDRLQAHLEASPRHAEIDRHGTGVKLRHLNRNCVGDAAGGGGSRDRRGRTGSFLPPLEVCPGSSWEDNDQVGHEVLGGSDQRPPPAAESRTVVSRQEVQPEAGRAGLHQQPQCLPLLFPWMEESPPPPPSAGVLAGVAGRRGPGRLSSVAFLQDRLLYLQDPHESSGANRGVIRGVLPLELRDLVGSLILGPDGEVIQLSLYDNKQHPSHTGGDTQRKAVRVLSAEGEELPWVIVLQPENTHTEGGAEPSTDAPEGDDQHHRSGHGLLHLSQPPACSPSSHTGTATATEKHTKKETRWTPKKDAKLNVRLPPLMEQGGKEQRGGEEEEQDEEDEEDEEEEEQEEQEEQEEEQLATQHQQNVNTTEAAAEESIDESRRRTVAAVTAGERNMTTGNRAESDGQKTSRMRREARRKGQKTGSADPPIRSQKPEERTDGQRAETLPFVRKKRGGVKKSEDEEKQGEGAWQREESAGRRRRKKLKHKGFTDVNPEGLLEEEEAEEESHFKSTKSSSEEHQNKTRTNSKKDAKHLPTNDNVSQADEPGSVQSESSLRSSSWFNRGGSRRSAASSCERSVAAIGLASSRGCLSSCSVVMAADEQLKLNPVKLESSRRSQKEEEEEEDEEEEEEMEMERRRRSEREEEERKKQREKEQTEERMRRELEEERRKRSEELRLKRLAEEDERRGREEEEQKETRRKEERRRQTERLQRRREEEEQRRRAEKERLQLEETRRQEAESRRLQEMDESERREYLRRKEQEEEDRRSEEERRRRRDEEARLQAELLSRQVALLQQRLAFKRGLSLEAGGLEKTQGISRPWISSYFTLLQLLGGNKAQSSAAEP